VIGGECKLADQRLLMIKRVAPMSRFQQAFFNRLRYIFPMRQMLFHIAAMTSTVLTLAACGLADSHAYLPSFLRVKENEPLPPEPRPDIKRMVREI